MEEKNITIVLTPEEAEVIDEYIFRKAINLENAGLTDSKCYPNLMSVHVKIMRERFTKDDK